MSGSTIYAIENTAHIIEIKGADGQTLFATYYPGESGKAILLLHQLYTNRTSWDALIPQLQTAGYSVLAPDLRGYGQTRGEINWRKAQQDTVLWMQWLNAQPGIRQISTLGSSMGANLAVIGCADANLAGMDCPAVVAISPGLNYFGYTPITPVLEGGMSQRAVLLISSERDGYPARAVRELQDDMPDQIDVIWLEGNAHGMDLLDEALVVQIIGWLN